MGACCGARSDSIEGTNRVYDTSNLPKFGDGYTVSLFLNLIADKCGKTPEDVEPCVRHLE